MSRIVPLFLIVWVSILLAGCEIVGSSEADDDTEGQPAIQTDLVWEIYQTWQPDGNKPGLGTLLPLEQRISNTFRLVE